MPTDALPTSTTQQNDVMRLFTIILFSLVSLTSFAQWDGWDNGYVVPCEHHGNTDIWKIIRYREGLASWEKPVNDHGTIKWSDSCAEFDCYNLSMYFDVKKYQKKGPTSFCVYRESYDELYDYIEVFKGFGPDKDNFILIIGKVDEDGNVQNAIQIVAKPMTMAKPPKFRPCVGGMH